MMVICFDTRLVKRCTKCGKELPKTDFYLSGKQRQSLQSWCKTCNTIYSSQRAKTPEGKRERRNVHLKSQYGLTLAEYDTMLAQQSGVCAICSCTESRKTPSGGIRQLAVDHDHRTGSNRSLLCAKCNTALGNFDDNPYLLQAAIEYLALWGIERPNMET